MSLPSLARYGLAGQYYYQQVTDTVYCSNLVSGSPIAARKQGDCLLSDTADFDGDGVVDSLDAYPADGTETIDSDGDGLGDNRDPFPSDPGNASSENWIYCIGEFFECKVPVLALVRYGLDNQYFYQQVSSTIYCNNSTFGNPIAARKQCEYLLSDTTDFDGDGVVDRLDAFPNDALKRQIMIRMV